MKQLTGILLAIFLLFTGCEKAFMDEDPKAEPREVFNVLWEEVDRKYTFFEFKNVDWDSVNAVYSSKIRSDMTDRELFDVLAEMLNTLKDGHVNLVSDFDRSRYWDWYLDYPQNFDFTLLERHYLKDDYRISDDFTIYYKKFDSIGYMYVPTFRGANPQVLDEVLKTLQGTKGIIVDVRDNGGGSVSLAEALAGRFTDKKRKYAKWQYKNGPGHDDFTKIYPRFIEPEGNLQYTKPVVLLVNRSSYSATNDFALALDVLPHATLIGDTTGGGGGIPYHNELPNGWTYRLSSTITWTNDMENAEAGIPPDIDIDMRKPDKQKNKDTILDTARVFLMRQ